MPQREHFEGSLVGIVAGGDVSHVSRCIVQRVQVSAAAAAAAAAINP